MSARQLDRLITAWIQHYSGTKSEDAEWAADREAFKAELVEHERELAADARSSHRAEPPAAVQAFIAELSLRTRLGDDWLSGPTAWAAERVRLIMYRGDEEAWAVLLELVRRAPEELLTYVSAGPIEDFLSDETLDRFRERFEQALRGDVKLRAALAGAWHIPAGAQELADEYPP